MGSPTSIAATPQLERGRSPSSRREHPASWLPRFVLAGMARVFGAIVRLRNAMFAGGWRRGTELAAPVISVGNVSAGGTGKTPVVLALAKALQARGHRVAILTRGYRSGLKARDSLVLENGKIIVAPRQRSRQAGEPPDEARLQAEHLADVPVVVGARRAGAARRFLAETGRFVDVWLLDDGFQHRQIRRQCDIVLLSELAASDAHLLPLGLLREPLSAVARADFVLTVKRPGALMRGEGARPIAKNVATLQCETRICRGTVSGPVRVAAGIADPAQFVTALRGLGIEVVDCVAFADHERFTTSSLLNNLPPSVATLAVTSKDYWRQPEFFAALNPKLPVAVFDLVVQLPRGLLDDIVAKIGI